MNFVQQIQINRISMIFLSLNLENKNLKCLLASLFSERYTSPEVILHLNLIYEFSVGLSWPYLRLLLSKTVPIDCLFCYSYSGSRR